MLLIALTAVTVTHWVTHPTRVRSHHLDPVMAHFYGAPPMAMLTVGAGALLLGKDVFGLRAAVDVDWVLWFAGTVTGLAAAAIVPYLQFTRHAGVTARSAFGGRLMPIVPPMVSASTGALLVPYAPAGQARLTLLMAGYAMFGLALIASIIVITLIWYRLATHKIDKIRLVPTLWIVLGPLGQSITAANLLGAVATKAMPRPYSTAMQAFGVLYGVPVWGFALLWACLGGAITIRTARAGMPFSLTWWSFTFPVGTCVTGTSGLAPAHRRRPGPLRRRRVPRRPGTGLDHRRHPHRTRQPARNTVRPTGPAPDAGNHLKKEPDMSAVIDCRSAARLIARARSVDTDTHNTTCDGPAVSLDSAVEE